MSTTVSNLLDDTHIVAPRVSHVIYNKQTLCNELVAAELDSMTVSELPTLQTFGRTCEACLQIVADLDCRRIEEAMGTTPGVSATAESVHAYHDDRPICDYEYDELYNSTYVATGHCPRRVTCEICRLIAIEDFEDFSADRHAAVDTSAPQQSMPTAADYAALRAQWTQTDASTSASNGTVAPVETIAPVETPAPQQTTSEPVIVTTSIPSDGDLRDMLAKAGAIGGAGTVAPVPQPVETPVAAEHMLLLYTSAPASADLAGTEIQTLLFGRFDGEDASEVCMRRVAIPASQLLAQHSAYRACENAVVATVTQWQGTVSTGLWIAKDSVVDSSVQPQQTTTEAAVDAPQQTTAPEAPQQTTVEPIAPSEPVEPVEPEVILDCLLYTNAPEEFLLRRTQVLVASAGVYKDTPVSLIKMHPEDVVRQARTIMAEEGFVALDTKAWRQYGVEEETLSNDATYIHGLSFETLLAELRSGTIKRCTAHPPSAVEQVKAKAANAPVIRQARSKEGSKEGSSEGTTSWRNKPEGCVIPKFEIVAGPQDTSPIPAEHTGEDFGYCKCGQRAYGGKARGRGYRCDTHWRAYMVHRNAHIDAFLAAHAPTA